MKLNNTNYGNLYPGPLLFLWTTSSNKEKHSKQNCKIVCEKQNVLTNKNNHYNNLKFQQ